LAEVEEFCPERRTKMVDPTIAFVGHTRIGGQGSIRSQGPGCSQQAVTRVRRSKNLPCAETPVTDTPLTPYHHRDQSAFCRLGIREGAGANGSYCRTIDDGRKLPQQVGVLRQVGEP
jgi:hypothetical protein